MAQLLPPELLTIIFNYKYIPKTKMIRSNVHTLAMLFKSMTPPGTKIWYYVDQIVQNYMNKYKLIVNYCFDDKSGLYLLDKLDMAGISRGHYCCRGIYNPYLFKKFIIIGSYNPSIILPGGHQIDWRINLRHCKMKIFVIYTDKQGLLLNKYGMFGFIIKNKHPGDVYDFIVYISEQIVCYISGKKSQVVEKILSENKGYITKLFNEMYPRTY